MCADRILRFFPFPLPSLRPPAAAMGNQTSLTAEQLEDIKMESNFTDDDLLRLFRRFKKLDTDHSGALSVDEFMAIPELEANPLVRACVGAVWGWEGRNRAACIVVR